MPSALKSTQPILTVAPVAGASVGEGASVMTVSGRPVFVLRGAVPAYRDLTPGITGTDVRQLQAALARLGFFSGAVSGVYDGATAAAVAAWYTASGFAPFGPTPAQLKALRSAQATVSQAQGSVFKAKAALDAASGTQLSVVQAQVARRSAVRALHAAQAKASQDAGLGAASVQTKTLAADMAGVDAAAAARALAAAQAGLDPTTGLPAFTPEQQAQLEIAVVEAQRAVQLAQGDLAASQQTAAATQQADASATAAAAAGVGQAQQTVANDQANLGADQATLATDQNTLNNDQAACNKNPPDHAACSRISNDQAKVSADQNQVRADQRQIASDSTAVQSAQSSLVSAQTSATKDNVSATADINSKTAAVANASDALAAAQRHLSDAQAGLDPSTGQPRVTPLALAKLQDSVTRTADSSAQAQSDLAVAQQTAAATKERDRRAVNAALDDQMVADARLAQAQSPRPVSVLNEQQRLAAGDLQRAESALAQTGATVGVSVPADEVLFFPTLPLRVDTVKLKVGSAVSGPVMQVSTSHLAVDSALSLSDATLVRVGAPVSINEANLGITVPGTVSFVAAAPGTNGVDPQHVYLEVTPARAPAQLVGASVKLTIAVKTTHGRVLAVPVSALTLAGDGSTRVQVSRGGHLVFIPVVPGLAAGGLVEVKPVGGATLAVGDQVVVGSAGPSVPPQPPTTAAPVTTLAPGSRTGHSTPVTKPPGG